MAEIQLSTIQDASCVMFEFVCFTVACFSSVNRGSDLNKSRKVRRLGAAPSLSILSHVICCRLQGERHISDSSKGDQDGFESQNYSLCSQ